MIKGFYLLIIQSMDYGLKINSILILIFLYFFTTFFEVGGISIFLPIFGMMTNKNSDNINYENNNRIQDLTEGAFSFFNIDPNIEILLIVAFILLCFRFYLTYITTIYSVTIASKIRKNIKNKIFYNYLYADINYLDNMPVGNLSNTIITESGNATKAMMMPVNFLSLLIQSLGTLIILLIISLELTLVIIPIIIISSLIPYKWIKLSKIVGKKTVDINKAISIFLYTRLKHPKLIKISNTERSENNVFRKFTNSLMDKIIINKKLATKTNIFVEPIVVGFSIIMVYLGYSIFNLGFNEISVFMFLLIRLIPMQKKILTEMQSLNESKASLAQITNRIDEMYFAKEINSGTIELERINSCIKMKDVHFSFADKAVLKNINVGFNIGEVSCIIGPSGAGKTTLVDLIPKIRIPNKGSIFIDDINYEDISLKSLRKKISYVYQNPMYLSDTIFNHIAYGNTGISIKEIESAALLSGAHEFIIGLKDGYNSRIGEDALKISGGQKQRIDIARALVSKPQILILDEPTTGLDSRSIEKFYQTIKTIKKEGNVIIIIISHDLKEVEFSDKFLFLNNYELKTFDNYEIMLSHNDSLLNNLES